jgi:putative ABC transport system permease protein
MKFLPLVWSAVWRRPAEALLICLAVTAAFTLFCLMLGLHATYRRLADSTRMDRLDVYYRFPISTDHHLTVAMREQIKRITGVAAVGVDDRLLGYYQDPHNTGRILAVDREMRFARSELPVSASQWDRLFAQPTGVLVSTKMAHRWHLKEGDTFPFISPSTLRADGSPVWPFQVLAIVPDRPSNRRGYILANYAYIDSARPPAEHGYVRAFTVALINELKAIDVSIAIDELFANSGTATFTVPERTDEEYSQRSGISAARVTWPVAFAGIFMILLVTANGIAQSVRERIPEFAVLSALGFSNPTLCTLVVVEAVFPCLLGALLGTAVAGALTRWPAHYLPADLAGVPTPTVSPLVAAWAIGFAIALALVSSSAPVLRLRRLSVTEALAGR